MLVPISRELHKLIKLDNRSREFLLEPNVHFKKKTHLGLFLNKSDFLKSISSFFMGSSGLRAYSSFSDIRNNTVMFDTNFKI